MIYIPRRLAVTNDQGKEGNPKKEIEYLDTDFFDLDGPLIILGEPGSGKTEIVNQFAKKSGSKIYKASELNLYPEIKMPDLRQKTVVDGVDEVTAYQAGPIISNILAKFANYEKPRFVLTCRAVDWQDAVNNSAILNRWQEKPVVGRILPFSDEEVIAFVNANGNGQNGEKFIKEARRHELVDLLRNPQTLIMLLSVVQSDGWPETKLKLYENASLALVRENNQVHDSINRTRPAPNKLLDAAGFICTQLLFSGKSNIWIDGSGNPELPRPTDFSGDGYDESLIQVALSTKIFRPAERNILELCHRSIGEFLSGKWVAKALQDKLSVRRLENLLYANGYVVPTALRGVHAWVATFSPSVRDMFIARDPYGFFRYGDSTELTTSQLKDLLGHLGQVAEKDPYFRGSDWHAAFGKGLAKSELKDEIVPLIRNISTPYQLSHLIIKSIKGSDFINGIVNDLQALVLDKNVNPSVRIAAADALVECKTSLDWTQIVNNLTQLADSESFKVALRIVEEKITLFDGATIANLLIGASEAMAVDDRPIYVGLGYGLDTKMSSEQLEHGLQVLSQPQLEKNKYAGKILGDVEKWIFTFAQERLMRNPIPTSIMILSWIKNVDRQSVYRHEWDKFSTQFFLEHADLRQSIQTEALKEARNEEEYWKILFNFVFNNPSLHFNEDDLILQMSRLLSEKNQVPNWRNCLKYLINFAMSFANLKDVVSRLVESFQEQHGELKEIFNEIKQVKRQDVSKYEQKLKHRRKSDRIHKMRKRHRAYEKIKNEIKLGQHLQALNNIAKAYLGRFIDLGKNTTPADRVGKLVGNNLVQTAFEGLNAAIQNDNIPTAKEIAELNANNKQEFHIMESILLAYCVMQLQSGQVLSDIPFNILCSALAACRWDLDFGDDFTSDLQTQLEQIIFAKKDTKEAFVRDTIEPYLSTGESNILGLWRVARTEQFSDIAGSLAVEWLKKCPQLSNNAFQELIMAAVRYSRETELVELIRERVSKGQWKDNEQRDIWMAAAFLLDYEHHLEQLTGYAAEKKEHLWPLKELAFPDRENSGYSSKLNEAQNHFLITKFGPIWPPVGIPGGFMGLQNPWDASRFIERCISDLAATTSDKAEKLLRSLINHEGLEGYQNHIKHVYAQQARQRAEERKVLITLDGIRNILLKGEPANHDDLQALVIDELEGLQDRIKNSSTNEMLPFWNHNNDPHQENYCRDRITAALTPYLERYNVRLHTEGTMPDNNRCDLLCTFRMMNVPIEIKAQWHSEIWSSASEQLGNYTREYHSEGRGIFLVLWFGYLGPNHFKNPRGWQGQELPKIIDEMNRLLKLKYKDISEKTKIFVLDVSR